MVPQENAEIDIYARVSRLGDKRMRSTDGQVADCKAVVVERGAKVGKVHVDPGKSAWDPRVKRKEWTSLMERLESGATGGVVVFDLARFSRRPIEGERLIEAAERGLLVLDSEGEYDLSSASGKKAFRDQLAAAAYESDRLSTRVKRGKKLKAMNGEPNVSSRPFGWESDGTACESEEAVLRDHTRRLLAGESQDPLIAELNVAGVLTSYGKPWTRAGYRQVMTRPRNAGRIVHRGVVVGRLPGDPVIDPDDFDRLCAMYAARRSGRPPSPAYLCSGTSRCGLCQARLVGRPRKNVKPYPDGGVNRQYFCSKSHGGCGRIAIDQRALDAHVAALVVAVLSDERHASAIEAAAKKAAEQAHQLDAAIAELEELAERLSDRLGRGEMDLARYDAATKPLDKRLAVLRAERDAIPDETVGDDVTASRTEWQRRWDAATVDEQRTLLRMALRGRPLLIHPADPSRRTDVSGRVAIGE